MDPRLVNNPNRDNSQKGKAPHVLGPEFKEDVKEALPAECLGQTPQRMRKVSRLQRDIVNISHGRRDLFSLLRDKSLSGEKKEMVLAKARRHLSELLKAAKELRSEIIREGGRAPAIPACFDLAVKLPDQ